MHELLYSLYRLQRSPFLPGANNYLCPLRDEGHLDYYADVAGFKKVREDCEARAAQMRERPVRVLVCGEEDSGRTSVANYVAHYYARSRNIVDPPPTLIPVKSSNSAEMIAPVRTAMDAWVRYVINTIGRQDKGRLPPLRDAHHPFSEYGQIWRDHSPHSVSLTVGNVSYFVEQLLDDYREQASRALILIEEVEERLQIGPLLTALEPLPFLVVTTTQEGVADEFCRTLKVADKAIVIEVRLRPFQAGEIETLVEQRWRAAGGEGRSPYETPDLVFKNYPATLVQVLGFLEVAMNRKLSRIDPANVTADALHISLDHLKITAWNYFIDKSQQ